MSDRRTRRDLPGVSDGDAEAAAMRGVHLDNTLRTTVARSSAVFG